MLSEWTIPPDDILERWTDERLNLFWQKRNDRIRRHNRAARGEETEQEPRRVSHEEFFNGPLVGPSGSRLANPNALRFKRMQVMNVQ